MVKYGRGLRVILIDSDVSNTDVLSRRLRAQGYSVEVANDAALGATRALASPPSAVICNLWMPGISGVQICRLLNAEASTMDVPVILRGPDDEPRNRFWAQKAGATEYVAKGRMGELVRALERSIVDDDDNSFFTHLSGEEVEIRDRIAAHLDEALFASVVAAEVRALGSCGSFERLFDLFSQLVAQITPYRWLAVSTQPIPRLGLHASPSQFETCAAEARHLLKLSDDVSLVEVMDEDATSTPEGPPPYTSEILFGGFSFGTIALAPDKQGDHLNQTLVDLFGRELGGSLRMVNLVEESQRLASTDVLTGLYNRRALCIELDETLQQCRLRSISMALMLLDVDHFKRINDEHGHGGGDLVLSQLGTLLSGLGGIAGRWGGEEFVLIVRDVDDKSAMEFASNLRLAVEALDIVTGAAKINVTVSVGVAMFVPEDTSDSLVDRADRAMYHAKSSGRNQVCTDTTLARTSIAI